MKLRKLTLALALIICGWAFADNFVTITFTNGTTTKKAVDTTTETLTFNDALNALIFSDGTQYSFSDIDHISFVYEEPSEQSDVIYVTWNGTDAPTIKCSAPGVTSEVNGGDVTMTNTNTDTEYTYVLDGTSTAGSFTLVADYKSTIKLNGLDLQSDLEEALNIKCGKRIALELVDGTTNTLADCTTDNGQKGALYCKGHLEVSGAGTLNLTGNIKHAISTKEYCQLKKTVGTINIVKAANDGIHAGQYFQMNGGSVTIKNVGGDGIQAEVTDDETDEDNGQMIIKGGTLNITTTGNDVAALKSDSLMTINDGTLTLSCSGNGSKGLKSDTDIKVNGGTLNITNAGGLYEDTGEEDDPSEETTKSYKVYVSIPGSNTGGGGMGGGMGGNSAWTTVALYKSDGTLVANLSSTVTITSGYTTTTFYYYDFKSADTGTYYFKSADYTSKGGGGGGSSSGTTYSIVSSTFNGPSSGSDVYYSITNSYSTSGTTRTYTISDVTSTYSGGSSTTEGDLSSSHGIKGDNSVEINGGEVTINMTGTAGKAISSDYDITVNDGTVTITNSGAGQLNGSTSYTAKGFTADRNVSLVGGNITVKVSGAGGKGIKADNNIYIGDSSTGNGPTLSVITSGSGLGSSSSGGGMGPGGMGGTTSSGSSAKAIKCMNEYYQYGGDIYVETASDGAEGIESKVANTTSMNFNGGNLFMKVYDDCINSAGQINFNGANVICYSTGNDAIDSNYGRTGAITMKAGTVIAFSQPGGAEMGIDADNTSYVVVSGGTLIAGGGQQGGGGGGWGGSSSSSSALGSGSTHNAAWSTSISYTSGSYYSIVCGGKNIITWKMPCAVTSSYNIYASDAFTSSTTHTIYKGTTAPTSGTTSSFHSGAGTSSTPMLWVGSDITSGTSVGTFSPN